MCVGTKHKKKEQMQFESRARAPGLAVLVGEHRALPALLDQRVHACLQMRRVADEDFKISIGAGQGEAWTVADSGDHDPELGLTATGRSRIAPKSNARI
jgi:hypothetical protein